MTDFQRSPAQSGANTTGKDGQGPHANVVAFPKRGENAFDARLAAAMASLSSALEEQRRALSDWHFALTELGIGVAALGQSLDGYQDSLGKVENKLGHLREESRKLESWADGMLNPPKA